MSLDQTIMKSHRELTDQEFLDAFENCSLSEELFTHEAHLRLGWLCIQQIGLHKSIMMVPMRIMAYTKSLNKAHIFNLELTVAAVKLIDHFKQYNPEDNFEQFLEHNPRLINDLKGLIIEFYGEIG